MIDFRTKKQTSKKLFQIGLLLLLAVQISFSQACDGILGDNIFLDGDFGSGTDNILQDDPQIAPGYAYQTSPPPDDGFYTITNNTAPWGGFASDWDNITDNSDDPNGYMMVVNASYDPGIFYQQEVTGLCDNTLYYISVDVYNLIASLNPNISFEIDGVKQYETGSVPYNETWNTYDFTYRTENNQTSINLSLKNNAPGGNGNDLAIDNISFRPCGPQALILPEEIEYICEDGDPLDLVATIIGDQYDTPYLQWQQSFDEGSTWQDIPGANDLIYTHTDLSNGYYYYRFIIANDPSHLLNSKCYVASITKVVRFIARYYSLVDTICEGLSYPLGELQYFESGIYEGNFVTESGCDSIVTLDLTVVADAEIDVILQASNPSCDYLQDGSIEFIDIENAADPFFTYVNGSLFENETNLEMLQAGDYEYSIVDNYGCTFQTTISLQSPEPFTIEIGPDFDIELGTTIAVNPIFSETPVSVQWNDEEEILCNVDCDSLSYLPFESGALILSATSIPGCIAMDTINLKVEQIRKVYFPNIFTPDGDGSNDFFTIFGDLQNVDVIEELYIYDRWGNLVFKTDDLLPNQPQSGWNGKNASNHYQPGVYTYLAKIRFIDGKVIPFAGDVTLTI